MDGGLEQIAGPGGAELRNEVAIVTMLTVPIADLMSGRVVSIRPAESVRVAIARMLEENIGSVAVCEEERLVVSCRYFLELSEEETAQALGLRRGTVKSRLSRGLTHLREAVGDA